MEDGAIFTKNKFFISLQNVELFRSRDKAGREKLRSERPQQSELILLKDFV